MQETAEDLAALQALLERSIDAAGPFLRSAFQIPACSMTAAEVVAALEGTPIVSFATVTRAGEPRVAPTGALFWRGRFHIPTVMEAARTRHIRRNPAVSLTWYDGVDRAMIVHGRAVPLGVDHADFATLDALFSAYSGESVSNWGEGAFLRVDAETFFTFERR